MIKVWERSLERSGPSRGWVALGRENAKASSDLESVRGKSESRAGVEHRECGAIVREVREARVQEDMPHVSHC